MKCDFETCVRDAVTRGYCDSHYKHVLHGKLVKELRPPLQKLFIDLVAEVRECGLCRETKPFSAFNRNKRGVGGVAWSCKECSKSYQRERSKLYRYGLTSGQIAEKLILQGGVCAVCGTDAKVWVVDHDHRCCPGKKSCGKCVRGILCSNCNVGLGMLGEASIMRAAQYLQQYGQIFQ